LLNSKRYTIHVLCGNIDLSNMHFDAVVRISQLKLSSLKIGNDDLYQN
jgi:hypothetical protein